MNTERLIDILQNIQEENDGQPVPVVIIVGDMETHEITSVSSEIDDENNATTIIFGEL